MLYKSKSTTRQHEREKNQSKIFNRCLPRIAHTKKILILDLLTKKKNIPKNSLIRNKLSLL